MALPGWAALPPDLAGKWYGVVVRPRRFFDRVNRDERGQRAALTFFTAVLLVGRARTVASAGTPLRAAAIAAMLLLLSPVVLHVVTALQYLAVWLVTERDEGVDRTLRAVAYGSAPGALAAAPYLGAVSFLGIWLVAVGIAEGHGLRRRRAAAAAAVPSLLLFGIVFGGFDAWLAVRAVVAS